MKTKYFKLLLLRITLCLVEARLCGQGNFQNLDFEAANIQQTQAPGFVNVTDALPSWTVYYGTSQQSQVIYNTIALGSTEVSLHGTNGGGANSIEGGFSVFLQGGLTATDASIRQTSLVPVFAESILFKAQPGSESLLVSLGGQNIPFFVLVTGPNYTLYGGDVSAFANQTLELKFSALHEVNGPNWWNIDSIEFSPNAIPEPSIFGLFALGSLLLGWRIQSKPR